MENTVISWYQSQADFSKQQIGKFDRLINIYSFLRLFALLFGAFILWQSVQFEKVWLTEFLFLLIVLCFAWLVRKQGTFERLKIFYTALKEVNDNEIVSIEKHLNIYPDGSEWENDSHVYTSDLDIFGRSSLFNLINRCASPLGNEKLAIWLRNAAETQEIYKRQQGIKELSQIKEWVQQFKAELLFARTTSKTEIENLFSYVEAEPRVSGKVLKTYIRIIPFATLSLAAFAFFAPKLSVALIVLILLNVRLVLTNSLRVNQADRLITKAGKTLSAYSAAFGLIEKQNWKQGHLKNLTDALRNEQNAKLSSQLKQLGTIAGKLEARLNIFVGPFLNGFMAWDVRQLIAIEDWKERNKTQLKQAFDVVAEFEAIVSLGSLHLNYPNWCFPQIATGDGYTYTAAAIGHPLIFPAKRVNNDFTLQDELKIDIITGSNMAGKSTFLRTLGINAVLALAGAPVCSESMEISNMRFFAYMRIKDSLNESISTFRAELIRLQLLLDVLKQEEKVYFLIDEMLRGTNSVDKYLGSKAVIEKLIAEKGVGIVATHDLQIARLEDKYPDYVRNFYFDIEVVDNEMLFDYKLKEGECKTFNASLLLRQLGIEVNT